ncbi:MAG: CDP-alcohol phosphatidyltransferase family protein [Anaerolineae bacterium]|nr:CDP-alcohol phosphatidyltransferase family protein [Anaerolineae bacterium]
MLTDVARAWGVRVIHPLARLLTRLGFHPNTVTLLGFALNIVVAAILAAGHLRLAGALAIFTLAFDAVDGTMARTQGKVSRFGAFLDSTLDRWTELLLYTALIWYYLNAGHKSGVLLAAAALGTSFMVSYARARAEGVGFTCKEGVFTRFERLLVLIIGLLSGLLLWALALIAALAGITAIQRILVVWRAAQADA